MARLVSRSDLARLAGVSPAAITKACKRSLKGAVVGRRIDLDHTSVAKYLKSKGIDPTSSPPTSEKPADSSTKLRLPDRSAESAESGISPEEIHGLEHLTLEELMNRFGTLVRFKDWLDARKKLADTREKELRYQQLLGRLVEREFVRTHVMGVLESGNRRLLGDAPKTVARRVVEMVRAGATVEEVEATVRDIISKQLRPLKTAAARSIRNAR